jgi:disulfide oxidoreductase YuzD
MKEMKAITKKIKQALKRRYSSRTFRYGYLVTT